MYNFIFRVLCAALVLSLTACGGGGSSSGGSNGSASGATTTRPTNSSPVISEGAATSVSMSVNNIPTAFNLTLHATDANGDTLTWGISSPASNGTASASGTGTSKVVNYTPNPNYVGSDKFGVQVSDGNGGVAMITVNVTISNNKPVIQQSSPVNVNMSENGTPTALSQTLDASDANKDSLTWSLAAPFAAHGSASVSATVGNSVVVGYTPDTDYIGTDSFGVQVADSHGGTATITVDVTVTTTNTVAITVDAGPLSISSTDPTYNRPFVSVTICDSASTASCQTIDHIVVDTGAVGLRILSSAFTSLQYQKLPTYNDTTSTMPIGECYPLVGGYLWGTLRTATVQIGGEVTASPILIQVINDPAAASTAPSGCTGVGTDMGSVSAIKANGILGLGYFKADCGAACTGASNNVYYTCTNPADSTTCSTIGVPTANQVLNPVPLFGPNGSGVSDNNGVIISLPAVGLTGATDVTGTLTFGVNTQPNNQLDKNATILTVDNPTGFLSTQFNGVNLCNSAIDSGSNNLNFPQGTTVFNTPPLCSDKTFYCPASGTYPSFTATLVGLNGAQVPVDFNVTDPGPLSGTAFTDIAAKLDTFTASYSSHCPGANPTAGGFIWGLPFFFARNVAVVIEGNTVESYAGPFIAF